MVGASHRRIQQRDRSRRGDRHHVDRPPCRA